MYELGDFDKLMELAKDDPKELERIRVRASEALIEAAPTEFERGLRGLQFRIDMERRRSKTPLESCVHISRMMHDSVGKMSAILNKGADGRPVADSESTATVIPFRMRAEA